MGKTLCSKKNLIGAKYFFLLADGIVGDKMWLK